MGDITDKPPLMMHTPPHFALRRIETLRFDAAKPRLYMMATLDESITTASARDFYPYLQIHT